MKTASFFTYTGPGRVCIARFAPRGTPQGFRIYRDLAPGAWFNSVTPAKYVELFTEEILGQLDAKMAWDQLHEMAGGAEPHLLCWEKPSDVLSNPETYCHRALVAAHFERELGVVVPELGYEGKPHPLLPKLDAKPRKRHTRQRSLFGE